MSALKTNGARTTTARDTGPVFTYEREETSYKGTGWILYATIMLGFAAAMSFIWGIAAVSNSHFFVAGAQYILSDLNTWGWITIGLGAVEVLAALSIWRGGAFGRWFGIAAAILCGLSALMSLPAYPLWSLVFLAIAALVIYGLAVYGGKPELTQ
jgi:hypothetical protein